MQTHKDVWFSVSDQQEHIYFRGLHYPHPLLEFLPWPIKVSGIFFPDGTSMYSASEGAEPVPTLYAGTGIALTFGVGSITITNTLPEGQDQSPWTGDIDGNDHDLHHTGHIGCGRDVSQWQFDCFGDINISDPGGANGYTFRINGVPIGTTFAQIDDRLDRLESRVRRME